MRVPTVRKRKQMWSNGKPVEVIEVHHHHHHVHPVPEQAVRGGAPPISAAFPATMHDPMGDIHPMPIGAGTWSNPVPQISYQQATCQNQFTIILGCIVCPVATFICVVIWLAVFGVIQLTDIFGNPW